MIKIITSPWWPAPAPADRPLFAIGDVHGRADLLAALHDGIRSISTKMKLKNGALIHLGDYIDRGPKGLLALRMALAGAKIPGLEDIALPGNHEQFLRLFLETSGRDRKINMDIWFDNGGHKCGLELGFDGGLSNADRFADMLTKHLGEDLIAGLASLPNHVRFGRYVFVHAGLHPAVGLEMLKRDWKEIPAGWMSQDEDPLWIRGPFLTYEGEFEENVIVVHGHTPRNDPELKHNRIGVDTRAYSAGILTAVQIDGDRVRFVQACEEFTSLKSAA